MPYVERDGIGQVIGLFAESQDQENLKATEWLEDDDPEVIKFREQFSRIKKS